MALSTFKFLALSLAFMSSTAKSELNDEFKVIETNNGKVRGVRQKTLLQNVEFYWFKGIPYAKSPTGELRFKPPQPTVSWSPNIIDASKHGNMCIQPVQPIGNVYKQSEDCLFLNVYVPKNIKTDEKLAVMVHIHGGGYGVGSGNDDHLGPDFLIEKGVIVVTLNYRLGVFGFLSFGTPEYSGNMGLKDQQLALKWIHSNIEHFSGDNTRITLFGFSAGGSSTHFQLFSPESRKYFRNIISISGTVDVYWALSPKNDHLNFAYEIAAALGDPKHSFDDLDELIAFFKTMPAENMTSFGHIKGFHQRISRPNLAPVIERKDAFSPFIVDLPSKIYDDSKIDVDAWFAHSSSEFISFYSKKFEELNDFTDLDTNFTLVLPFRNANLSFDSKEYRVIAQKIRSFYFGNSTINENSLLQFLEMLSDINFAYGIDSSARKHANKSNANTFYYRFSVDSKLNLVKRVVGDGGDLPGAGHGGESCYLFRCTFLQTFYDEILQNKDDEQSKISLRTIDDMTKLFTNFAKFGNPTQYSDPVAGFLPIQPGQVNFLDITNDGLKPGINPNQEANELWNDIERRIDEINAKAKITTRHEL